jgi:hypothetical protein
MPLVRVSGKYRFDQPEHTEQGLRDCSEVVGHHHGKPGNALVAVAKILKKKDPSFDSLKTHKIEVIPESPEAKENVEPEQEQSTPDGEDSGAGIFQ